jgi:hypothetical protein
MHKSLPVAEIALEDKLGVILSVDTVHDKDHLPVGTSVPEGNPNYTKLTQWWKARSIPASRSGLRHILERLNVPVAQTLVKECYGLSLSDQYWIRPENSGLKWESINFFQNAFSEDVGNILFGGKISGAKPDLISPDSTSDGQLKKRWKVSDGRRCLIKGGSNPFHQEPLNEVLASALLHRLRIPRVAYTLMWEDNKPYSVCEDFITPETELVSAIQIFGTKPFAEGSDRYAHFLDCCDALRIPGMRDHLDQMLALDFLIDNSDRHFGNFGAVRHADTLEWIGPAPLFDNGTSLWCSTINRYINADAETESATFYQKHIDQLTLVTSFDWLDFDTLDGIGNAFAAILETSPYIDDERLTFLCQALERRAEMLEEFIQEQTPSHGMRLG